jgi:hypothetical protein
MDDVDKLLERIFVTDRVDSAVRQSLMVEDARLVDIVGLIPGWPVSSPGYDMAFVTVHNLSRKMIL